MTITVHIRDRQRSFIDATTQIIEGRLFILRNGNMIATYNKWDSFVIS
jgi:hypothetical protein